MFTIKGSEKLAELAGLPASFHGAEVLSILLHRDVPSATLTLLTSDYKELVHIGSSEVSLFFSDVENVHIEAFNHQNVVSSLSFDELFEKSEYSLDPVQRIHVTLDTVFGAWATFSCSGVDVVSVKPSVRKTGAPKYNRPDP